MTELEPLDSADLIARASGRGVLSPASMKTLQRPDRVDQIDKALEESYGVESADEVVLVTMMPDDSGSMTIAGKNDDVILGHNDLLDGFRQAPSSDKVMLQTRYLNGFMLNPFQPLGVCARLTHANYPCRYSTPLFEQTIVTLGTVMAKTEELLEQGATKVRSATLIMTDAEATGDPALREEVASVISDMRRVGDHIVAGMGFTTVRHDTAFRQAFIKMGIDERFIFSAGSRHEILQAFKAFGSAALALTAGRQQRIFDG